MKTETTMSYRADAPENTRLFILCGKGVKEELLREKFEQYGKIEDLWVVKDKRTNEDKGVVYITFSKTSESALAMEEMNGKILPGNPKPMKVMIANTKRDGSVRDPREDEKMVRLFVIIPKTYDEDELTEEFKKYGDVHSVNVLRDKDSGSTKGFGYVKFHRPYHAALALENCDKSFKPKFAEPKKANSDMGDRYDRDNYFDRPPRRSYDDRDRDRGDRGDRRSGAPGGYPYNDRDRGQKRGFEDFGDRDNRRSRRDSEGMKRGFDDFGEGRRDRRDDYIADDGRSRYSAGMVGGRDMGGDMGGMVRSPQALQQAAPMGQSPLDMIGEYGHNSCQRLHVTAPLGLTQNYLSKLFNLIPGLEYCDLNEQTGVAYVRYQTPQCATYARDKLDQFEYPIGSRLIVRFADNIQVNNPAGGFDIGGGFGQDMLGDNPVHQAALVLEKAGINPDIIRGVVGQSQGHNQDNGAIEKVTYCNIGLPLPKALVPEDRPVQQRLFVVCQPAAVPERILRDAFSRFGNLIDVYLLSGRNFGYAKFANKECAANAIRVLHGQSMAGQRLKVLEAEPMKHGEDDGHKRQRVDQMN